MASNRLASYLQAQKLSKLHLAEAEDQLKSANVQKALWHLIAAHQTFQTAINCLASLAFEARKRKSK